MWRRFLHAMLQLGIVKSLTAGFIYNSLKNKHKSRSEKFLFYELLLALRDCANRAFRSCCIHSSNKPNLKSAKGRKFDCSNCGKKFPVIHQCYWQIMPCPNSSTVIVTSAQKCQRPREIIQELNQMGKRLRKTATHVECAIRHLAAYHTWSSTCEYTLVKSLFLCYLWKSLQWPISFEESHEIAHKWETLQMWHLQQRIQEIRFPEVSQGISWSKQ